MKNFFFKGSFFLLHMLAIAQSSDLKFKHLSVQDGLSQSWTKCFLEDQTGLLWIGTNDGLNKYDGKHFKVYKYIPEQEKSLNNNTINTIFEDSKGKIWVGTQAGLNYYQQELDIFVPISSINNYITSILELKENSYLVGVAGGLYLFNPINYTSKQLYNDIYVEKILKDSKGHIWLATHSGLMLFNPKKNTVQTIKSDSNKNTTTHSNVLKTLFEDSKGGLWIGSHKQGLSYLSYSDNDPLQAQFINLAPNPLSSKNITKGTIYAIEEDEDQNLWVGIENGGINILRLDDFYNEDYLFTKVKYDPSHYSSLSSNSIHSLYADRQNTIWIGTYAGGVSYYNKILQRFGHHQALPNSSKTINSKHTSAILDEDDYLWIGTENGLNLYHKSLDYWEYFTHDFNDNKSISSNAILTIKRDSENNLWVGTFGGGLNLFNEKAKTFTRFTHDPNNPKSIGGNNVVQILETKNKELWVGTVGGGIANFHPNDGSFTNYQVVINVNSISSNWIIDLTEDNHGNIWILNTTSVDVFNPKKNRFSTFAHNPDNPGSMNYNGGTCLFKDSKNTVWIGTSNGLNYFIEENSSFGHYTVEDGLPSNSIKSITEDSNGNIWLSTNNTITMFINGTALSNNPKFRSFSVFNDMQSSEFNNHSVFNNNEMLFFGSTNGYFSFNPSEIKINPHIPEIIFTDLQINNEQVHIGAPESPLIKDISLSKQLKFSKNQNVFTIEYAALNFLQPKNNEYAFKLEGFDKQWNYVGHQQSATYTNLDHGTYNFLVKASNNDEVWNEKGASIEIIILPAWWQTWYAKTIYALLFIFAISFFRKHTIISVNLKNKLWIDHLEKQKVEELTQMKQQFFANVSHELRTPLTLILGPLKKLMSQEKKIPELKMIFQNSTRLKMLVDQFLDFSKIESQMMNIRMQDAGILDLTKHIMAKFNDFANQKNIEIKLETTFSKCLTIIDKDKYEKILTNLLSNAVKSITTKGTILVQLEFDTQSNNLLVRIKDTGRGIPSEDLEHIFDRYYSRSNHFKNTGGTGIGLYLTRELIRLQKGAINVNSTVGKGSTFTVILPIKVTEFEIKENNIEFYTPKSVINKDIIKESNHQFEKTILIVDDNKDICDFVETILYNDYNVVKINNPLDCIDKMIEYMPDLVISDVMMPEMDGFELCKLIKEDVRFSHIPVILLTAKATKNSHIEGYEIGADDYIYKPFEEEILKARIKSLISKIEKLRKHFIGHDGIINPDITVNTLDKKFIEDVLTVIKKNYLDPNFKITHIIEEIGMSRSLFYKKFKALSDESINDLIKNFRLKKAATLLSKGHFTVSQIAYDCGFSDPAYFSRVFKEYYNTAPKDFGATSKN